MDKEELHNALRDLIAKGLVEETVKNGVVKYKLTPLGRSVGDQLLASISPKN